MLGVLAGLLLLASAGATDEGPAGGAAAAGSADAAAPVAATPEAVRDKLAALREAPIQWEFPEDERTPRRSRRGLDLPLMEILITALGAVLLVTMVFLLVGLIRDWRRPIIADPANEEIPSPAVHLSGAPLARAEAAAREGRFAEAIHLLLLGTIEEIRDSLGYEAHPSLTSREILRRAPLPDGAEPPLRGLVGEVEWSHFGARGAGEEAYRRCVEWHGELRRACSGGAAAGGRERGPR